MAIEHTAASCASAHPLGWSGDSGTSRTRRAAASTRLSRRREEVEVLDRRSRAGEIQLLRAGLSAWNFRSSSVLDRSRGGENDQVVGNGVFQFGHSNSGGRISGQNRVLENRLVRKGLFKPSYSGGRILGENRGLENHLVGNGLARLGYSGGMCVSAAFKQPRVDVDGREIRVQYRREGREINSGVVFAQQGKGKKEEVVKLPNSVDHISSPSNAYVKHLVRLRQNPKARAANESVLIVGTIPLREICESTVMADRNLPIIVDVLLVREDSEIPQELAELSRRIVRVSADAMSKLSGLDSPPEIAGVLPFPPSFFAVETDLNSTPAQVTMRRWCGSPRRILVLDSIQDPGNLGTLLRTAAAFAWDGVFLLHGCCDPFNDKALRASRGASFRVPIGIGEWEHVRDFAIANELKLFAGDPEPLENGSSSASSTLFSRSKMEDELKVSVDGTQGLCLVLGSEGQGLSEYVTEDCVSIGIPMPGNFESLNVAVAGGILMFLLR